MEAVTSLAQLNLSINRAAHGSLLWAASNSGWFRKRIMWCPSMTGNSTQSGDFTDPKMPSQLSNVSGDAKDGKHAISSPIGSLLKWSFPSAVIRGVRAVIFLSTKTMARWPVAHVGKEVFKLTPSLAHINSAPSVVFPGWVGRARAAINHLLPKDINPPGMTICGKAMFEVPHDHGFGFIASTGSGNTLPKRKSNYLRCFAAITQAFVANHPAILFPVKLRGYLFNNFKSSKTKSNQGYFLRHGIGSSMFMFSIGRRYTPLTDAKILLNPAV